MENFKDYSAEIKTLEEEITSLEAGINKYDETIQKKSKEMDEAIEGLSKRKQNLSPLEVASENATIAIINADIQNLRYEQLKLKSMLSSKIQTLKYTRDLQRLYESEQKENQPGNE